MVDFYKKICQIDAGRGFTESVSCKLILDGVMNNSKVVERFIVCTPKEREVGQDTQNAAGCEPDPAYTPASRGYCNEYKKETKDNDLLFDPKYPPRQKSSQKLQLGVVCLLS
jgi:hypothetical protein